MTKNGNGDKNGVKNGNGTDKEDKKETQPRVNGKFVSKGSSKEEGVYYYAVLMCGYILSGVEWYLNLSTMV